MRNTSKQNRSSLKCRPGPVTRNPYLNFLREYRMKNKCQPAIQQTREAAKAWQKLNPQLKSKYIVEAFYARKIVRRRRSASARRGSSRRRSGAMRRRRVRIQRQRR